MAKAPSSSTTTTPFTLPNVLRIVLHLTGALMLSYGVYFNFLIKFPKRPDVTNDFAGKLKYLTTINAVRVDFGL